MKNYLKIAVLIVLSIFLVNINYIYASTLDTGEDVQKVVNDNEEEKEKIVEENQKEEIETDGESEVEEEKEDEIVEQVTTGTSDEESNQEKNFTDDSELGNGEGENVLKTPVQNGEGENVLKTPVQNGEGENVLKTPAQNGEGESELETPAQNGEGENVLETPVQNGEGENVPETPAQNGEGESELETPAQNGEGENVPETPVQNGETEGNDDEAIPVQKVKVITTKVDEDGNYLSGVILQILNSENDIVDEWTTDATAPEHETLLPNGIYTLHEKFTPDGYIAAEDQEIIIDIKIPDISAGVNFDSEICDHHKGFALYYVQSVSETGEVTEHEVYCINQNWEIPDETSIYEGEILNPNSIKNYTRQTVPTDATRDKNMQTIDISDPDLESPELYNKILDIIYHRNKAAEVLGQQGLEYTESEIRFITEVALKNYTNTGITEVVIAYRKSRNETYAPLNVPGVIYDTRSNGDIFYLRHNYRDYVYIPDAELGSDIATIDFGKGTSFGQIVVNHWNGGHNAKNDPVERARVARYYELFKYLISDEDHHPDGMHLYIYSSGSILPGVVADDTDNGRYQNLLGVTGYLEDFKPEDKHYTVVNKYDTKKKDIQVEKIWDDNDNQDGIRPDDIKVTLYADDVEIDSVILNTKNEWKHIFKNLDVYNKGQEIQYRINEIAVKGYDTQVVGFTITNTHTPEKKDIPVEKIWDDNNNQDGIRPDDIKVILYADNVEIDSVILNAKNEWKYIFENLDVYKHGKKIDYVISEPEVKGYNTKVAGFQITNTHTPEKKDIPVEKLWDDNNNQDGIRPDDIKVILYADDVEIDSVILNAKNEWKHVFKNLDVYKDGTKIVYTINEIEVEGYDTEVEGFTITNTHTPEKREVSVIKIWDDKEDYEKLRPKTVTIILKADGVEIDSVLLSEKTGWSHTFKDLDVYKDGKEIVYTINEIEVDKYYTEITGNMYIGFEVKNTHFGEGDDNPPTGDNIIVYITMLIISVLGLIKLSFTYIKNN
ncbi:MAG: Cna B-type domain-containing protein [Bacilli bacterium]|nr:Cna B-type domain-containing protein [Bacilli bacterium]